jgi:hypothetical protein
MESYNWTVKNNELEIMGKEAVVEQFWNVPVRNEENHLKSQ